MAITLAKLATKRKVASTEKDQIKPLLDEVYEFAIPYRKGISQTGAGEKRTNRVFDHTLIVSSFRSANRMAQDIAPAGQQFFDLKLGPLAKMGMDDAQQKKAAQELEFTSSAIAAHFASGEWDTALAEMALDLMAGTGAMLILPDRAKRRSRFVSVPLEEIKLTSNGFNEVNGIFWERRWSLQSIADEFGDDKFTPALKQILTEKPEGTYCLHQDTVYDVKAQRWERIALIMGVDGHADGLELERSTSRACPWLTPRYFRVPGETFGRGPIMLVMPTAKALNTGKKLTLQAAAIALLGVYTAIDDGVFNPDNFVVAPGAVNKVARNGGALGPSIQKFPEPRIDLTQLIFKDMGMEIQMGMNDQQLPPDGAAVRSATEILERVKRLASDHMGAFGRLIMEIVVPAVSRVMEIAYDFKQLPQTVDIDRLLVDIQVSSPMALAREAERLQKVTQVIDMFIMLLQAKTAGLDRYAKTDLVAMDFARSMGMPERYLPSDEERAQQDEQKATEQAAMAVASNPEAMAAMGGAVAEAA